jgi:hydrogenase nickel incorporation protein HypA/HybF
MHEMSLAQSIVEIVEEQAKSRPFTRVRSVRLSIGALSYVDPHALEFGFELVARGTAAEGAELRVDRPAGSARCDGCSETFEVTAHGDPCPRCGQYAWLVVGGDEMRVTELEVE